MTAMETHEIRVRGTVQGVGFRPTVYMLAAQKNLVGEVFNDAEGVLIRLYCNRSELQNFVQQLDQKSPPLAKIDGIESKTIQGEWHYKEFSIRQSESGHASTEVSADAATCDECLNELLDPQAQRYLYPFTNCTHCGPRISIVKSIPYDRKNSTMAPFPMCDYCRAEYQNPVDRRFHAQPIACFDCGPQLTIDQDNIDQCRPSKQIVDDGSAAEISSTKDKRNSSADIFKTINEALCDGKIVAIRGIGGFHLCCDAANHVAVKRLRKRKQRYAKPFALMVHDIDQVKNYCELSELEIQQLNNSAAPIVLLDRKKSVEPNIPVLSEQIAPGTNLYGFMMPYTPLHWLVAKNFGGPLVMTSGNLSHQPQIIDNQIAREQLSSIADLVLYHNRDIANRIDDSVVRCMAGKPRVMRRARGYAPRSFKLPRGFEQCPQILACGAELKSTFCLTKNGSAMVSQHQGDLEDISTFDDYLKNLSLYQQLFDVEPKIVAVDRHPEYVSSKYAKANLVDQDNPDALFEIQHHHAHIASCMVENLLPIDTAPVLGIALDGLGYGEGREIWGGEFLLSDYNSYTRVGRFKPVAMLGGTQAIKQPWRNTYTQIVSAMSWTEFCGLYSDLELCQFLQEKPLNLLERMLTENINSPAASSCGRLFDAVSAALNLCRSHANYEGQGAIELEMKVQAQYMQGGADEFSTDPYHFTIAKVEEEQVKTPLLEIDSAPMWRGLLDDLKAGTNVAICASKFHAGLIDVISEMAIRICKQNSITTVALSGGCLQNKVLLEGVSTRIESAGLECLMQSKFPSNDGGISLGQAAVAAAQFLTKAHKAKPPQRGSHGTD